ncbi:MAG TPA: Mov34/MPN/PAD-1 family protein [Allosphingosinicella sp.]|nr:Mov34/MPN/PAD-1 family protein [Allosphingosinicella sp.]
MKVELPAQQRRRMHRRLLRAGRREIGGILMGEQLAPGHFRIVDFSVDSITGSRAHFVRDPRHHKEALDAFFTRTGEDYDRYNYLGEWHSHPSFAARPSLEDVASMTMLVERYDTIPFSILLIVRTRRCIRLERSAMLFQRGGYRSEVEIV